MLPLQSFLPTACLLHLFSNKTLSGAPPGTILHQCFVPGAVQRFYSANQVSRASHVVTCCHNRVLHANISPPCKI